jgi:hypothetical protein
MDRILPQQVERNAYYWNVEPYYCIHFIREATRDHGRARWNVIGRGCFCGNRPVRTQAQGFSGTTEQHFRRLK